jgi:hypothetical protein
MGMEYLSMEAFFSNEIQDGLDRARKDSLKKSTRLRIDANGKHYPVLRMWKTGFAVDAVDAPQLRGFVDLYDGAIHLFQCLIVAGDEDMGEMQYEFKRATAIATSAALDFERLSDQPAGYIENRPQLA